MRVRTPSVCCALVACLVIGGCASPSVDRGYVQREWAQTLRELGIVPVFPPREDLFVGDVYAYEINPEGDRAEELLSSSWSDLNAEDRRLRRTLGMSPRLHRVDLNGVVEGEYQRTLAAPATPDDYNSILGNQAFAAAQQKVADAEAALKAVADRVKAGEATVAAAKAEALEASRAQEDAEAELAAAKVALTRAQAATPDTSAEQQAVDQARTALRAAQQDARDAAAAKRLAQATFDRLAKDSPDREAAQKALYRAIDLTAAADDRVVGAQEALKGAEAELAAAKTRRPGVASAEQAVRDAEDKVRGAEAAVVSKQRALADAESKHAALTASAAPELTARKAAVAAAKSVRDAIAKAGEKLLFAQPRDAQRSVYSGSKLPWPDDPNDLVNARINRLRLVGFPEFATASFTKGDLSALIPIEAFSLGLNASAASATRVSVKVPAAESYAVPISALVGPESESEASPEAVRDAESRLREAEADLDRQEVELERLRGTEALPEDIRRREELLGAARAEIERSRRALAAIAAQPAPAAPSAIVIRDNQQFYLAPALRDAVALQFAARNEGKVYVRVPTEVFYARALDVSVFYADSFGVQARLAMLTDALAGGENTSQQGAGAPFDSGPGDPTGADLLRSVEASLGKTMSVPGGAVQLVGVNETSVGLRRVFDRPVAIGFRGITLEVDRKTWLVTGEVSGGWAPTKFGSTAGQ